MLCVEIISFYYLYIVFSWYPAFIYFVILFNESHVPTSATSVVLGQRSRLETQCSRVQTWLTSEFFEDVKVEQAYHR